MTDYRNLVTYHGSTVYYDQVRGRLGHRIRDDVPQASRIKLLQGAGKMFLVDRGDVVLGELCFIDAEGQAQIVSPGAGSDLSIMEAEGGRITIVYDGCFLSADQDGLVRANRKWCREHEHFALFPVGGGDIFNEVVRRRVHDSIGPIHVINLDKSSQRMEGFAINNPHISNITRFSAVDGNYISREQLEAERVIRGDLGYGAGTLGCAMSHIELWKKCLAEDKAVTIAEDDILISAHFEENAARILTEKEDDWDIIFWGFNWEKCFLWLDFGFSKAKVQFMDFEGAPGHRRYLQLVKFRSQLLRVSRLLGLYCYTIKPKAAQVLLNECLPLRPRVVWLPGTGQFWPDHGIDVAMSDVYPLLRTFAAVPPLVLSDHTISDREGIDHS